MAFTAAAFAFFVVMVAVASFVVSAAALALLVVVVAVAVAVVVASAVAAVTVVRRIEFVGSSVPDGIYLAFITDGEAGKGVVEIHLHTLVVNLKLPESS